MSSRFHALRIAEVRRETADAISVRFDVPQELRRAFAFVQGQHIALRTIVQGEELRRSYSICTPPQAGILRIAIKRVPGGAFSQWAMDGLRSGDFVDVLTPEGGFHTIMQPTNRRHYAAFAAGSGITPILSILQTALQDEPMSRCSLVYGNQRRASALFQNELEDMKDRHLGRFALYNVYSREPQDIALYSGRLDGTKAARFLDGLIPPDTIDDAFVCGPGAMIEEVCAALLERGVAAGRIHSERFGVPPAQAPSDADAATVRAAEARVTIVRDGRVHEVPLHPDASSILEAATAAGLDLPYSCRSGMCCSCRARVLQGETTMRRNFGLGRAELDAGFVLTCQALPVTREVTLSFDDR